MRDTYAGTSFDKTLRLITKRGAVYFKRIIFLVFPEAPEVIR